MYISHPSSVLNALFAKKPYQGIAPDKAKFLFVGLDANYGSQIEHQSIFPKIHEYHGDGIAFWHKYGVHHPFLLPEYSGDGKFYHRSFAQIGFKPEHANLVSFVELLHLPTVGRNKITIDDLDQHHLNYLNSAILEGSPSHDIPAHISSAAYEENWCFPMATNNLDREKWAIGTFVQR